MNEAAERHGAAMERWRVIAEKVSGGSIDALRTTAPGGLVTQPLYLPGAGSVPQPWRSGRGWAVAQRVDHPDPASANAAALADLVGGASALTLVTADSPYARGFGLAPEPSCLAAVLDGVELDLIGVRLDARGPTAIAAMAEIAVGRRLGSAGLAIDGGCDPIGAAACAGTDADLRALPAAVEAANRGGFSGCPLLADGRPYHECGAGEVEELAAVLATAVAYLRHLAGVGMALEMARDAIAVLLPLDAELLNGIAKVRSMRRLWACVEEACGLDPRPLRLHAETSWRCMTRRDPYTNILRASLGASAAGLGGADIVTILPMTLAAGLPDAAARRLARNTGHILVEESQLARVDDPAGGSGAIEAVTETLCDSAWALFQQIEAAGGLPQAAAWLHARIAATASRRSSDLDALRQGIVGSSLFPSLQAVEPPILDRARRPAPSAGLPRCRDAESFEALRDRGEAAGRPSIFLAALGMPAAYGPHAAFAANMLAIAGLEATAADGVDLFRTSGARIACVCGTEDAVAKDGEAAIARLRKDSAAFVLVTSRDDRWLACGADALIHEGCPMLRLLGTVLDCATSERD